MRFGGETSAELSVEDPWITGNHLSQKTEFFQNKRFNEIYEFNEKSTEVGIRVRSFIRENGRIGGMFSFLSLGSDIESVTLDGDNRDSIPTVGAFVGYDSRDSWTDPQQGWWTELETSRSGGDADFWSFTFDVRRYQPVTGRHNLVLFSLTTLRTGRLDHEIPRYLAFNLGGGNTVRGWSLGSRAGKNQTINTVEYRFQLMRKRSWTIYGITGYTGIQATVFGELGSAWDEDRGFEDNSIGGYGFGFRFIVPFVDEIRVDFGFGEPGRGVAFYIGIQQEDDIERRRIC